MNAFTIDTEDWFQVSYGSSVISRAEWPMLTPRISDMVESVLDLLSKHNVLATFFVVGWVGEQYPALIRKIAAKGHEIASHGYWHTEVFRQTPSEFALDIRLSKDTLEQAIGAPVKGYRAPGYSIGPEQEWALEIVGDAGHVYDSSLLHASSAYSEVRPGLVEIAPNSFKIGSFLLPTNGGFFFRIVPYSLYSRFLQHLNANKKPLIFYTHTWEIFVDYPHIPMTWNKAIVQYANLKNVYSKLDAMLGNFHFTSIERLYPSL